MNCPSCQSENTQRLQVIFEAGSQNIQTTSQTSSIYTSSGPVRLETTTTGTSITELAQKCSPPPKADIATAISIGVGGVLVYLFAHSRTWVILSVGAIGVAIYMVKRARSYNTHQWPPLYEKWSRSWHCNKCGNLYSA